MIINGFLFAIIAFGAQEPGTLKVAAGAVTAVGSCDTRLDVVMDMLARNVMSWQICLGFMFCFMAVERDQNFRVAFSMNMSPST